MERLTKKFPDGGAYCEEIIDVGIKSVNLQAYVGRAVDRLAEYEDLEEQGQLLKLPCAVGDMVYKNNPLTKEPVEIIIESIFINYSTIRISGRTTERKYTVCIEPSDFGSTVFLTKEEAVLKTMTKSKRN